MRFMLYFEDDYVLFVLIQTITVDHQAAKEMEDINGGGLQT